MIYNRHLCKSVKSVAKRIKALLLNALFCLPLPISICGKHFNVKHDAHDAHDGASPFASAACGALWQQLSPRSAGLH